MIQEGDRVEVTSGPFGGMRGTVTDTRGMKLNQRGRSGDEPLVTTIITIKTDILRTIRAGEHHVIKL